MCEGATLYEDVFEVTYSYCGWGAILECHAYGTWGAPTLAFSVDSSRDGDTVTTTLTSMEIQWPGVELGPYYDEAIPSPPIENSDCSAAWIVANRGTYVSVSNTLYASSVFKNESTGRYIPEVPYSFTSTISETKTLYLCFCHPNGTTIGWVKVNITNGEATVDHSCIATGVYTLRAGTKKYTEWPVDPATFLNGGIRQLDIYVDASATVNGTGLSWDSPFKSIQEAVDAVRLDGTTIHVKPGVYGSVKVDNTKFVTNHLAYTFTVESTDGPEKTIIDGGHDGVSPGFPTVACFWYGDNPVPLFDTLRVSRFAIRSTVRTTETLSIASCRTAPPA